jgi:hypothetical protein
MVLEHIIELLVDPSPDLMSVPLLVFELELMAFAWGFSGAPAHLISLLA